MSGSATPVHPVRFVTAAALFDGHDAAINIMRMFAGEGDPFGNNRRFKLLSAGNPATRRGVQPPADHRSVL
jgi:hypothetical protein